MRLRGLLWWVDRWRTSSAFREMTLEQQAAYRNLFDEAALRGGGLPNDERVLARACGEPRRWTKLRPVVLEGRWALQADGCWHHPTLDRVLKASARHAARTAAYRRRHVGVSHEA